MGEKYFIAALSVLTIFVLCAVGLAQLNILVFAGDDETSSFRIYDPNKVRIAAPVVYYKLDNGSIAYSDNRNPFDFTITHPERVQFPDELMVYKIEKY